MTYVALLRGINVGGKQKVDMKLLKSTFERAGMENVSTYINSGNVIFRHDSTDAEQLAHTLETAIARDFGFHVKVLLRDSGDIAALAAALPDGWVNDDSAKCDVMFLWAELDTPEILERLEIRPVDEVRYVAGAVLWRVERADVTRSGLTKVVGTETYKRMTVRNCNTVRRLAELVRQADADEA